MAGARFGSVPVAIFDGFPVEQGVAGLVGADKGQEEWTADRCR
jgi:hypothetical protein